MPEESISPVPEKLRVVYIPVSGGTGKIPDSLTRLCVNLTNLHNKGCEIRAVDVSEREAIVIANEETVLEWQKQTDAIPPLAENVTLVDFDAPLIQKPETD